jgi:hypothetical protein
MIYRLWTTGVKPTQVDRYHEFADSQSLPMLRAQRGFREAISCRAAISTWC